MEILCAPVNITWSRYENMAVPRLCRAQLSVSVHFPITRRKEEAQ